VWTGSVLCLHPRAKWERTAKRAEHFFSRNARMGPSLLNDGRVIYTRWDYVDRNAVHYQQLCRCFRRRNAQIYYGNNTWNPTGIWEARAVPGSSRIMATAAPHHGMSAGSVILLDTTRGIDGKEPLTRLTRDVRFPNPNFRWRSSQPTAYDFDTPVKRYWATALVEIVEGAGCPGRGKALAGSLLQITVATLREVLPGVL